MSVRVVRTTGTGLAIPESWIHIGSLNGQLPPKRSARIALELVTPAGAEPGNYVSDIVVTGSTTPEAGVNFGAAAATKLQFTITPGPAGSAFPAWTWWAIAGLVILAAAAFGWRRSGLRIRVERKKAA